MKKIIYAFVLLSFIIAGCSKPTNQSYIDIAPYEAKKLIDTTPGIIVIDVSPNYAESHLLMAISYNFEDNSFEEAIPFFDKKTTYLVYCHSENTSIEASNRLIDSGIKNVYRLKGGFSAWFDTGYPVGQ